MPLGMSGDVRLGMLVVRPGIVRGCQARNEGNVRPGIDVPLGMLGGWQARNVRGCQAGNVRGCQARNDVPLGRMPG